MKLDYSKLFDRMKSENIKHLDLKKEVGGEVHLIICGKMKVSQWKQ